MTSTPTDPQPARDAIIYLPGLSTGVNDVDVVAASRRLCRALDRNARSAEAKFEATSIQDHPFGSDAQSRRITIERTDPGKNPTPVVDVYELDYRPALKKPYETRTPMRQAFAILLLLLSTVPMLLTFARRGHKSFGEKVQVAMATAALFLLATYLVLLLATGFHAGGQWLGVIEPESSTPPATAPKPRRSLWLQSATAPEPRRPLWLQSVRAACGTPCTAVAVAWDSFWAAPFEWLQKIVVILAAIGLLSHRNVKEQIRDAATEYASVIDYVAHDRRKPTVAGNFAALLESVLESGVPYRRVHVLAYSFGSIVAIDCLFQRQEPPERFKRIDALVTVGSPFDIIRSFWPEYFAGRQCAGAEAPRWLNVFSPDDVMSSNFRDDSRPDATASAGVPTGARAAAAAPGTAEEDLGKPVNIVYEWTQHSRRRGLTERLLRFSALHRTYWGDDDTAQTFLDEIVRRVYGEDAMLG